MGSLPLGFSIGEQSLKKINIDSAYYWAKSKKKSDMHRQPEHKSIWFQSRDRRYNWGWRHQLYTQWRRRRWWWDIYHYYPTKIRLWVRYGGLLSRVYVFLTFIKHWPQPIHFMNIKIHINALTFSKVYINNVLAAFYFCKRVVLVKVVKIKCSWKLVVADQ